MKSGGMTILSLTSMSCECCTCLYSFRDHCYALFHPRELHGPHSLKLRDAPFHLLNHLRKLGYFIFPIARIGVWFSFDVNFDYHLIGGVSFDYSVV